VSGKGTPAIDAVTAAGVWHRIHEYVHDPAVTSYALEAAQALDTDPARIHKTLVLLVDRPTRPELVVAVVPADASCDVKQLAIAVGAKKADLADPTLAQRTTGYVVGGISPLGQRKQLTTVIDEEAQLWDSIFISAGRRGLDLELRAADLALLTNAVFAPIAKRT
jgi:Cys-tRNA(Pro)/Cys-tRNA(Cys) deacylase